MKKTAFFAVALALLLALGAFTRADFGGFSGDTDYGGGWDSGSSSSSYDSGGSGWTYDSTSGASGSGGSDAGMGVFLAVVIILLIVYASRRKSASTRSPAPARSGPPPAGAAPVPADQLRPLSELIEADPHFSESAMRERVSDLYVRFQHAWQQRDLAPVRPYLSAQLFAQTSRQLKNDYIDKRLTSYLDNIAVLDVQIRGYRSAQQDELTAYLRTRFINYTRNDDTGAVVRGSTSQEIFMEYEWTLARKKGVLTRPSGNAPGENCPNCGGVIDLSLSSKCAYCGTVLDTAENDWVVAAIKGLSQRGRQ